ncbi:hypothetical protein OQA88_5316 [Cercophora sp. LCS_1]
MVIRVRSPARLHFPLASSPFACEFVEESAGMSAARTQTNDAVQEIPIEDVDPERLAFTLQELFVKKGETPEVYSISPSRTI